MSDFTQEINGYTLEYIDDIHTYLVDGVIVPSVTHLLHKKFKSKYANVSEATLKRASEKGTAVHEAIEKWCRQGIESDLKELHNFKFLQAHYLFTVASNELPVIYIENGTPIYAGRLDLVIEMNGAWQLADIKRTATLDKEYLKCQLNLYRIAFEQSYNTRIGGLKGIHLKDDIRKMVGIPMMSNEETQKLIAELREDETYGRHE